MQYDVGRLIAIDVVDWTRTAGCMRGAGSSATRGEPASEPEEMMQQATRRHQEQQHSVVRLAPAGWPEGRVRRGGRVQPGVVVGHGLHNDGRVAAARHITLDLHRPGQPRISYTHLEGWKSKQPAAKESRYTVPCK